jgi:hypothetical protein
LLFIQGKVLVALYVDDAAVFSPEKGAIDKLVKELQDAGYVLTDEGDLKDYLGVRFTRNKDGTIELNQPRIIQRCLEIVKMLTDEKVKIHDTPAEVRPILTKDSNGKERRYSWNYRAIVGTLGYLQGMTRPDLSYSVHQCAQFSGDPKQSHEQAIKRICRYLKGTSTQGLKFKPDLSQGFQCYVDADWAGNWNKDCADDPANVFSRSGYLITYAGCPVIWG